MRNSLLLILILSLPFHATGQPQAVVRLVPFSSMLEDEFSPVYFEDGLIFCANKRDNGAIGFTDGQKQLLRIFRVSTSRSGRWNTPKLLSTNLVSGMNDGPSTYSVTDSILYFSRNNEVSRSLRNITEPSNKLGIYMSARAGSEWFVAKPFPYNDAQFTLTTPSVTADGNRLYFASDKPGGIGGMDLYYCDRNDGQWSNPVNLGPLVNTTQNEVFPYAADHGRLYFASDGHPGLGGKDIFYTVEADGNWITPVHLDSAINSVADDFGLVTDSTFSNGYFSSNRRKTYDIYSFTTPPPVFANCDTLTDNQYCYTFYDERQSLLDTLLVEYRWDFGDGEIMTGIEVGYCFPGPGNYTVKLNIVDALTGKTVTDEVKYEVNLEEVHQGFIHSMDVGTAGLPFVFNGSHSNLPDKKVVQHYWDIGEGFSTGGPTMQKPFGKKGIYTVQMGLVLADERDGGIRQECVKKTIRVYEKEPEIIIRQEAGNLPAGIGNKAFAVKVAFTDDLPDGQRKMLKQALQQPEGKGLAFNRYELQPTSMAFLGSLAEALKGQPDLRVQILVCSSESGSGSRLTPSERYAQSLGFTLKGLGMEGIYISKGYTKEEISALFRNREEHSPDEIIFVILKP